ncbi:sigma-70 family RNA polymerase sigma factor [Taibaiella lutea]|uniref:Sigma-70 family RNA polymerase sigma factor n=1 Tax=Taibaiella lutea TaxID=2608001 RepID=A0A5M6CQA4_9BACT|nr:sigma-70 family RNA polymerase sigma factor [Taibaiella lutea]KAA5537461.1 sigma-70 family RNA polymerase sigma factor [Taibaiella lutea]
MTKVFYTDTELLEGLASGDRNAVVTLYKLYHSVLTKWILSRGGLESDAEDVFQEALVVIFEKAKSPEFCLTCKLSTYLFAISKRLWFKKMEKAAPYRSFNEESEEDESRFGAYEEDLDIHLEKEEQFEQLGKAMEQLGEPCKSLLHSFYVDGKNMQEIAVQFHYTNAENAKTQKYKCLTRLKKIYFSAGIKVKN